jgi:hypothetical protein
MFQVKILPTLLQEVDPPELCGILGLAGDSRRDYAARVDTSDCLKYSAFTMAQHKLECMVRRSVASEK